MNGPTHKLVAGLAMALLGEDERDILYPRWSCVEAGSTLSDELRIMWEPRDVASQDRELVHRCFVDSDNPKDHGCVTTGADPQPAQRQDNRGHLGPGKPVGLRKRGAAARRGH